MHVFVTGANGFIGRHLVRKLVECGHHVTAMGSRRGSQDPSLGLPGVHWIPGVLSSLGRVVSKIRGHDSCVHLAGLYPLWGKHREPIEYVECNVTTTAVLLEAARQVAVERFVFASTAQVYGKPARVPIREFDPLNGATPYAGSKIGAEAMVRAYAASYGLKATSLRLFNVYGPWQPSANVVATIAEQALRPGPVSIETDTPVRDFVYVDDVVSALISALHRDSAKGEAVNVASGTPTRIGDLARRIMQIAGRNDAVIARLSSHTATVQDPDCIIADISLAAELLHWRPTITLDEGLQRTLRWTSAAGRPGEQGQRASVGV